MGISLLFTDIKKFLWDHKMEKMEKMKTKMEIGHIWSFLQTSILQEKIMDDL